MCVCVCVCVCVCECTYIYTYLYIFVQLIYIYINCSNTVFKKHRSKSYNVQTKAMTLERTKRID